MVFVKSKTKRELRILKETILMLKLDILLI